MSQRARARRGSQVAAVPASPRQRQSVRRTESETAKKYRLLADSVADVIFLLDMDLKPTYFSPSASRLTGRSIGQLMSGTLEGTITPASYQAAVKALKEADADEKRDPGSVTSRSLELELILADGSTKLAEATASYLRDADGTPIGIVGTVHD